MVSCLRSHPLVSDATVVPDRTSDGRVQALVAFVVGPLTENDAWRGELLREKTPVADALRDRRPGQ